MQEDKASIAEKIDVAHKKHREENWAVQNWRSWGSWFSWGSPIGLTLGYAIVMLATGGFIVLLAVANHLNK
jgi:hypothetical protein